MSDIELFNAIRDAIIVGDSNACPIAIRLAWHSAGTFCPAGKGGPVGGSNGATMRFKSEQDDGANAGLDVARGKLDAVVEKFKGKYSVADIWGYAGCVAVELMGGPKVPFTFGRTDAADESSCPPNGRLPDATKDAQHLRDVFGRMGFNDREIVALSGAHTAGRCHPDRSGFDGPWTEDPLVFDNAYFVVLMGREWVVREWDGPLQYTDKETGKLMMLPTDLVIRTDPEFAVHAKAYAEDEKLFFSDFAAAFGKLLALGCQNAKL